MMIGILDSGLGGLTAVRTFQQQWPAEDAVYFGDTARAPYGNKSPDTIRKFALEGAAFLHEQGADLIVVVCQAIAAVAGQDLAAASGIPVIDGIVPAAQMAVGISRKGRIGIIASGAAIESGRYPEIINSFDPEVRIVNAACPLLVPLIHAGWLKKPETVMIVKKYLHPLKVRQIDTLILADPYYRFWPLKRIIRRKIGRRVALVDPVEAMVAKLSKIISLSGNRVKNGDNAGRLTCWLTDLGAESAQTATVLYGRKISLNQTRL